MRSAPGRQRGPELGQLALLVNVFGLVAIVPNMLAYAALPVLSRSVSRENDSDRRFLRVLCRAAFVCGTLAALLGVAVGPGLVRLVFGASYELAGSLLGYMLALLVPLTIARAAAGVLWARHTNAFAASSAVLAALAANALVCRAVRCRQPRGPCLFCSGIPGRQPVAGHGDRRRPARTATAGERTVRIVQGAATRLLHAGSSP